MKLRLVLIAAALALASLGLAGCSSLDGAYVEKDAATYRAIAPRYEEYVKADQRLDAPTKARRLRTLASWRIRVEAARGKPASAPGPVGTDGAPPLEAVAGEESSR